jgi:hypothetical protein
MDFYESDLEDIIWECLQSEQGVQALDSKGLLIPTPKKAFRQLRIGNYGIADIVTVQKECIRFEDAVHPSLTITVFELKKDQIKLDTLVQVFRYIKGIRDYFNRRGYHICEYNVRGVLIGRSINDGDWVYLAEGINEKVDFYTYNYYIDGMRFEHHKMQYHLINNGFKIDNE